VPLSGIGSDSMPDQRIRYFNGEGEEAVAEYKVILTGLG
jgi:hypothetical protein